MGDNYLICFNVFVKRLNNKAIIPTKGSKQAAGYDLYACLEEDEITILPHTTAMIGTGLAFSIPYGFFGGIYARSGLASKQNLRPANCVGVVDSDFRGEVKVALHNDGNEPRTIHNGDRIAQLIIQPYPDTYLIELSDLDTTERGEGGFGSTGL